MGGLIVAQQYFIDRMESRSHNIVGCWLFGGFYSPLLCDGLS